MDTQTEMQCELEDIAKELVRLTIELGEMSVGFRSQLLAVADLHTEIRANLPKDDQRAKIEAELLEVRARLSQLRG